MPQIPVISTVPGLDQWRKALKDSVRRVATPRVPWNFTVTSQQGGNQLTWQAVKGADGYVVDVSTNGDFSTGATSVALPGNANTSYFDTVATSKGTAPAARYYRVRATSGTTQQPQAVSGIASGVIGSTAIAPNDTTTNPTSTSDTSTTDGTQAGTGRGSYRGSSPRLPL